MPTAVPETSKEQYDGVAVKIYLGKDHFQDTLGGLKATTPQTVVIQSPIIRAKAAKVLADAGMPGEGKDKITIYRPFKVLFFTYSSIKRLHDECDLESEDQAHFKVLLDVLDELFQEKIPKIADLHHQRLVDCQYVWTIFPKGILIYTKAHGEDSVYELTTMEYNRHRRCSEIHCRGVSFNGTAYGWKSYKLLQPDFHRTLPITDLVAYPLKFHPNADALEKKFLHRGETALEYQDFAHREYSGDARLCADEDGDDDDDEKRRKSANVRPPLILFFSSFYADTRLITCR